MKEWAGVKWATRHSRKFSHGKFQLFLLALEEKLNLPHAEDYQGHL